MSTENNNQAAEEVVVEDNAGEGNTDSITLTRSEYDKMVSDLGSLKREKKDWSKAATKEETPKQTRNDELGSLQERLDKQTLRGAGITHEDDIALAKETAKKWNVELDDLVGDEDFIAKLKRQQTKRSNLEATSDIKGSQNKSGAKDSPEYWLAQGKPPTREQVPDRKTRVAILRAFMAKDKGTGTFYND